MAYPVPNIEQWVYGMKTIVELNDSLFEEIKHHATPHHTTLRAVLERARWTTFRNGGPRRLSACGARRSRGAARKSGFRGKLEPEPSRIYEG